MDVHIPEDALPIQINSIRTPASVWASEIAREGMSEGRHKLHLLERRLYVEMSKNRKREVGHPREAGEIVVCQSFHDSRQWHRGKIQCRMEQQTGPRYKVFLLDQGIVVHARPEHLRSVPYKLEDVPYQALVLVLEGIVPLNLVLSPDLDSMSSEISEGWAPAADKFVTSVKNTYTKAYFVEKRRSPDETVRYGDIILIMPDEVKPVSLSALLCAKKYAKYHQVEFDRRQQIENIVEAPEICESPLSLGYSTDSTSRSSPSPARTMTEFIQSCKSAQPEALTPEPPLESSSDKGHVAKAPRALALFEQLKRSNRTSINTGTSEQGSTPMCSSSSLTKGSTRAEEHVSPVHSQSLPVEDSPPRFLGDRFIPAGSSIKKEAKAHSKPSSPSSFQKFSDSDDSLRSCPKETRNNCSNGPSNGFKPTLNGRDHTVNTKPVYSSDSSFSDSSMQRGGHVLNGPIPSANCSISSSVQTGCDSNDSAPCHSGNSSLPISPRGFTLLSKLRKQEMLPSSKIDDSSSSESTTGIIKFHAKRPDSDSSNKQIPQDFSSLTKNRLLSAPKISAGDGDISSEIYLARSVLLHGGLLPKPWVTYNDLRLKFSSTVEKYLMDRRWCYNILTIEKFMWPAIQKRQNVVMISPKRSGKTSGYIIPIMDFMCSLEEIPKGCGPLALILCSGSKSATQIYEECVKLVRNMKKPPQVQVVYGLAVEKTFIFKLLNGCDILITTPPCLLRLLSNHSYAMNFHRLQHFILDEADILMTRFLKEVKEVQAKVVAEQEQAIRTKDERDPIQIVVSSEKWHPHLLSFSEHLRGNPLLCINDFFEACVYGKPDVVFHLTKSSEKLTKLVQILKNFMGLHKVVVFCDASEVSSVEEFIENASLNYLVVKPGSELRHIDTIRSCWNSSKVGDHYILVCPDSEFDGLNITDATSVVHYSFPFEDKSSFVKRLSTILDNIPNRIEERILKSSNDKTHHLVPSIHLLTDELNTKHLPVIAQLMQRIAGGKLDKKFLDVAENISRNKERKTKMNKLFCINIKMFGQCYNDDCSYRHVFVPEFDKSEILPSSGVVSMQVTQVHSAGHYSVRLVEHIDVDRKKKKWPSGYVKIGLMMSSHFRKESNRICVSEINVGDLFAVETEMGLFQRAQILEVKDTDKYGKPVSLLVQYLDEGHHETVKEYMLYQLPDDLKAFPAQVVDVFLCGLLPADQDSDYGADANRSVKKWINSTNESEDSRQKLLQGQVMLSMTGCLWVDPVNILEWLPHTHEYVIRRNIKQSLLLGHFALPNHEHLPKLFSVCGQDPLVLSSAKGAVQCAIKPRDQVKPSWAFLESEGFEDIEFISAESVSVFFVRRVKFQPLFHDLIKDINSKPIPRKSEEVSLLSPGSICLAEHDDEWHRVRISSQNENHSFTVFYVDFGDSEKLTHEKIKCIPDWAITRLPFQAIECSLAGVSSCDAVDKLYDIADGRSLVAKVCKKKDATLTGGNHYVVAIVDCSKPVPSILNKDLLELDGVERCMEEMEHLDFELDESFLNRPGSVVRAESEMQVSEYDTINEDPDLDLSDLEFKEEDLHGFMDNDTDDGLENFEICGLDLLAESFKKDNKEAIEELAKQMQTSTLEQQPKPKDVQNNLMAQINPENVREKVEKADSGKPAGDGDSDWEEIEHDYIGRSVLPALCSARPPSTKWFEDLYFIWIKICLTGVENYFLKWTCDRFQFSTTVNSRHYHIDEQLRGAIVPSCVTSSIKGFCVEIKMRKAYSGMLWERLLFPYRKFAWLSRDLEAINLNSSDSEEEDALKTINKEIRKIPVKLRRRPLDRFEKSQEIGPDLETDSSNSDCEYDMVDSDEMF